MKIEGPRIEEQSVFLVFAKRKIFFENFHTNENRGDRKSPIFMIETMYENFAFRK